MNSTNAYVIVDIDNDKKRTKMDTLDGKVGSLFL